MIWRTPRNTATAALIGTRIALTRTGVGVVMNATDPAGRREVVA